MTITQFALNFFTARNHSVLSSKLAIMESKLERTARYLPEAAMNRWRFVKSQADIAIDSGLGTDRALDDLRTFEAAVRTYLEF